MCRKEVVGGIRVHTKFGVSAVSDATAWPEEK